MFNMTQNLKTEEEEHATKGGTGNESIERSSRQSTFADYTNGGLKTALANIPHKKC